MGNVSGYWADLERALMFVSPGIVLMAISMVYVLIFDRDRSRHRQR